MPGASMPAGRSSCKGCMCVRGMPSGRLVGYARTVTSSKVINKIPALGGYKHTRTSVRCPSRPLGGRFLSGLEPLIRVRERNSFFHAPLIDKWSPAIRAHPCQQTAYEHFIRCVIIGWLWVIGHGSPKEGGMGEIPPVASFKKVLLINEREVTCYTFAEPSPP